MKRFFIRAGIFFILPFLLLVAIYVWTDPFRCIHTFDLNNIDTGNREYFTTELFLRNQPTYQYNSFVFCSSRGLGFNTYTWKMYLPDDARPFLFQAWGETLTGIELKIDYLVKQHIPIDNALVLLDIPRTFRTDQLPSIAIERKHYLFTGESKFMYNVGQFYNFIQKPTFVVKKIGNTIRGTKRECMFDTITNDCDLSYKDNYAALPPQDSISENTRRLFFPQIENGDTIQLQSEQLITAQFLKQLEHIHEIFVNQGTDYNIVLTPAYYHASPSVNAQDLAVIKGVFGTDRVYDYTGKNHITTDYHNFLDPNHFGLHVGYLILQDIYSDSSLVNAIQ